VARSGSAPDGAGLAEVPDLVRQSRDAGLRIGYDDSRACGEVAPAVGRAVFRIVQEALTNVAKHAPGADATVLVTVDAADLLVVVANGPGGSGGSVDGDLPAGGPGGLGLPGMTERARSVGGSLLVERTDDGGFTVRARLPLNG
jgi:signal transduction histidine kinase